MPRNKVFNRNLKRPPKGIRKHIRKLKTEVNRSLLDDQERKEKIREINFKFRH